MARARAKKVPVAKVAKHQVTIVPHTHWDRAWYLPFEVMRARLVAMMDHALDTLEGDPGHHLTLDGQAIIVEDYLQVRPEQADRLRALVASGRLSIGPWYVLPDEFLVSGEALVRNLLLGREISEHHGGTLAIGYVPDPFGHIAQLPQLLAGFNIGSFVFHRGLDRGAQDPPPAEFEWEAPDGSRVLALWQREGYDNLDRLGLEPKASYDRSHADPATWSADAKRATEQIRTADETLRPATPSGVVLLANGSDHRFIQPDTPKLAARAARSLKGWSIQVGTLADHVTAVRAALKRKRLRRVSGELSHGYADLLKGVYSSRIALKQANARLETLLERYAEPLVVLDALTPGAPDRRRWFGGGERPSLLRHAWRTLLRCHPHDDICGCGDDQIHREMGWRFDRVGQVGQQLVEDCLQGLGQRLHLPSEDVVPYLVYNPIGGPRTALVRGNLEFRPGELAKSFVLEDTSGRALPYRVLDRRPAQRVALDAVDDVTEVEIAFRADDLPEGGTRGYYVRPGTRNARGEQGATVRVTGKGIETPFHQLRVKKNGGLTLVDLRTGRTYRGLHLFEDMGDAGDCYNYSPVLTDAPLSSKEVRAQARCLHDLGLFATLRVELSLDVPLGLAPGRQSRVKKTRALAMTCDITCYAHTPRVDVHTRVVNRSENHRLRVRFPVPVDTDRVHVEQAFNVAERSLRLPPDREDIARDLTQAQGSFVSLQDADGGLAILNRGLPEYEVVPDGRTRAIMLTLLRAVGDLSRGDLLTRPFQAGPALATPEAQCQGQYEFDYSLLPHSGGDTIPPEVLREAQTLCAPPLLRRIDGAAAKDSAPPSTSHLYELQPPELVTSALKPAADGRGYVIRFFNPDDRERSAKLQLNFSFSSAEQVGLDELPTDEKELKVEGNTVKLTVPGKRIVTLRVIPS